MVGDKKLNLVRFHITKQKYFSNEFSIKVLCKVVRYIQSIFTLFIGITRILQNNINADLIHLDTINVIKL